MAKVFTLTLLTIAVLYSSKCHGKLLNNSGESKGFKLGGGGAGLMLADEMKQTLEKYLFGICPQGYKMPMASRARNSTSTACDLDGDHIELAARLASLALRAHAASRGECSHMGAALASTFGELARTASSRQAFNAAALEANKKRKLSKSQKAKLQAKQRTALAVKKKAAAAAAAAATKITA